MHPEYIKEGDTKVLVNKKKESSKGPGSKDKLPFYNPSMELSRDLSILLTQWMIDKSKKDLKLLDGLAATGIRGVRILNENQGKFEITINDWSPLAYKLIKKNIKNYNRKVNVTCKNLNTLLSEEKFDYIDIDPFGSPVYFFDSAARAIKNNGIIAITTTDTATLSGVYPKVCLRRYSSMPYHSPMMQEIGVRILIAAMCRETAKYDKGIFPILSYVDDHYFRVYLQVKKSKKLANRAISKIQIVEPDDFVYYKKPSWRIGPLWMDEIQNENVIEKVQRRLPKKNLGSKEKLWKLLNLLQDEAGQPAFFYTTDYFSSVLNMSPPSLNAIFEELEKNDFSVSRTHFNSVGFKTDVSKKFLKEIFKKLKK